MREASQVRRNPSTVVILTGEASGQLLAAVGRSMNVALIEPGEAGIEGAASALRRAGGITAPYVLVRADPLAGVARAWQSMWDVTHESADPAGFELQAGDVLAAWRAGRFELPDYYLVLAPPVAPQENPVPDFYLGPLRSARNNRVAVASAAAENEAAEVLRVLGSLRHGPWWPPLDQIIETARGFYPGSLAEANLTQP
jgi:hypothetical protein